MTKTQNQLLTMSGSDFRHVVSLFLFSSDSGVPGAVRKTLTVMESCLSGEVGIDRQKLPIGVIFENLSAVIVCHRKAPSRLTVSKAVR
jgi:hypothetical protein